MINGKYLTQHEKIAHAGSHTYFVSMILFVKVVIVISLFFLYYLVIEIYI